MNKKVRHNKTKEEILKELKMNAKFIEKMKFTKEKFFPALTEATHSIDDALQNLSIINSVLMDKFLGFMKEKKMSELKMEDNLDPKDPKYEPLKAMLELFNDFSVYDAKDLMEGMKNEINLFLTEENKTRTLADLKPRWLDEIE